MNPARRSAQRGFTLSEVLTALIVMVIITAIAIPMWRNHQMRVRRSDAISALTLLQAEQDRYFGQHARYAGASALSRKPPDGLGLDSKSTNGFYAIELRTADDHLGYSAIARPIDREGAAEDARCVQFSIDHLGIRRAVDNSGRDRTADCWR
jgi:type IV pilus assembly protein PilE